MKIIIKKNDVVVKKVNSTKNKLQEDYNKMHDIAGGMWNGVDKFTVSTEV